MAKTKADPTGMAKQRNKGTRTLSARITRAESRVKALFRNIPRTSRRQTVIINEQITVYDYEQTPEESAAMDAAILFIISAQLLQSQDRMPESWYWKVNVELPYRQGTVEEVSLFNRLIGPDVKVRGLPVQPISVDTVLRSPAYIEALQNVYVQNYAQIKSLTETTANQVIKQINDGISAGETPTSIAERITNRFDVSRSSAKRIADTEINKAYNDAKLDAQTLLGNATGLRAGVLHISALIQTTRTAHAARHGNAYTVDQQRQWWNRDANRINCHCTTRSVLIDSKGKVVDTELQEEIKIERSFFDVDDQ